MSSKARPLTVPAVRRWKSHQSALSNAALSRRGLGTAAETVPSCGLSRWNQKSLSGRVGVRRDIGDDDLRRNAEPHRPPGDEMGAEPGRHEQVAIALDDVAVGIPQAVA